MEFDHTGLWLALGIGIFYLLLLVAQKKWMNKTASIQYSNLHLVQFSNLSWRILLYKSLPWFQALGIIFLLIALARPREGLELIKTSKKGVAIQMLLDRSSSMREPIEYKGNVITRLDLVKEIFTDFMIGDENELKGRPTDLIGLTTFAGFVDEIAPLTLEHTIIADLVEKVQIAQRFEDGTRIGDALYQTVLRMVATEGLFQKPDEKNEAESSIESKIIILLTDGQQTPGSFSQQKAAEFAKQNGIKVYTIVIDYDPNLIPQNNFFGRMLIRSPLNTSQLKAIAQITGGKFARATSGDELKSIYQQIDQLEKTDFDEHYTVYKEQFPLFLWIAFFLLSFVLISKTLILRKIP